MKKKKLIKKLKKHIQKYIDKWGGPEGHYLEYWKPCPFCGCELIVFYSDGLECGVGCEMCTASGPRQSTLEQAMDEWERVSDFIHKDKIKHPKEYGNDYYKHFK